MTTNNDKPHILVVDDEPMNRDLLRRVFQSSYEVTEAADADEAIEVLGSEAGANVALIVCDHLMPGKTGAEMSYVVHETWPSIPIILVTGFDDDSEVKLAAEKGMVSKVLAKPWRSKELRAVVLEYVL